jgi:hypothetical protein
VASAQIFVYPLSHDPNEYVPDRCHITLTDGRSFTESGRNAIAISRTIENGQPYTLYIKGGHIEKIIESGNTPVPAVYHFRQIF